MPTFHNRFQSHSTHATVFQLRSEINCINGITTAFGKVIGTILPFVAKSMYVKLPPEAEQHQSFEITEDDRCCECIAVPQRLLWSIRFRFTDKKKNQWFYDISIVKEEEHLLFDIKIDTMFGASITELQHNLSLVDTLINSKLLIQERPIAKNLWCINTPEDAKKLVELLEDSRRTLPVIAVSAVNRSAWSFKPTVPEYLVNASFLAEEVKGYAIVVQLTFQGAFAFTDLVGRYRYS